MIKVIIELNLVYPYKLSMPILAEFCHLWDTTILYGGTTRLKALISMPSFHFKKIFGHNARIGEYKVPSGTEHFIENLRVKKVLVK